MLFPSCVLLWHGLAVVLEPIAAEQWRSATARAAEHGIDVNLPRPQVPLVPSTANFLAHPFFQLFFGEGGGERDRITGLSEVIRPYLPRSSDAGDFGKVADLLGALEALGTGLPHLIPEKNGEASVGGQLPGALQQTGIPWHELSLAAGRPSSQLPPVGSSLPTDDYTAPENTLQLPHGIIDFVLITNLRTLAAIESSQLETARQSLLIQMRLADGFLAAPYLVNAIIGNSLRSWILDQIRAGIAHQLWEPADLDWIGGWLPRSDGINELETAFKSEIFFALSSIVFTEKHPGSADRLFATMSGTLGSGNTGNMLAPFDQEWLCFLRGSAQPLYRIAPPAVFQLWRAQAVNTSCKFYLEPLKEIGLLGVAFPDEPNESLPESFRLDKISLNFLKNDAKVRMCLISVVLREWHAIHQNFPATLSSLPSYRMESVGTDPFSSAPFIYQRLSSNSYRLYSVGADLVDDGGSLLNEQGKGDICWHFQPSRQNGH